MANMYVNSSGQIVKAPPNLQPSINNPSVSTTGNPLNVTVSGGQLGNPNAPGIHLNLTGWFVFLLLLYAWSKTGMGHEVIYYALLLILLMLVVRNYQSILGDFTYTVQ